MVQRLYSVIPVGNGMSQDVALRIATAFHVAANNTSNLIDGHPIADQHLSTFKHGSPTYSAQIPQIRAKSAADVGRMVIPCTEEFIAWVKAGNSKALLEAVKEIVPIQSYDAVFSPSEAADIKEKMRAVIDANPLHFTGMSDTDGATGIFGFCSTEEGKNMIKKIPGVTVSEPIHMMVRATNSRAAPAATAA